jgi:DNA-binding phage protein
MSPFAALGVEAVGAAGVAALLGVGAVSASTTNPTPTAHLDRHAVRAAVVESEADILGITPQALVKDLRAGQKVSDLAKDKGITQEQFETRLVENLKPRLETLVDKKVITQAQADKLLDRISKGHIPFWNGLHPRKK